MGKSVKSSGGFVMTYLFDEASHDELVSRNLKNTFVRKSSPKYLYSQSDRRTLIKTHSHVS